MPIRKGKFETPEEALERKDKEKIHKAAVRGAKFLDKKTPEWIWLVKPELLRMDDGERCVLGQSYGYFENGIQKLFGFNITTEQMNDSKRADKPGRYGFNLFTEEDYLSHLSYGALWDLLAEEWKALIRQRREAALPAKNNFDWGPHDAIGGGK